MKTPTTPNYFLSVTVHIDSNLFLIQSINSHKASFNASVTHYGFLTATHGPSHSVLIRHMFVYDTAITSFPPYICCLLLLLILLLFLRLLLFLLLYLLFFPFLLFVLFFLLLFVPFTSFAFFLVFLIVFLFVFL